MNYQDKTLLVITPHYLTFVKDQTKELAKHFGKIYIFIPIIKFSNTLKLKVSKKHSKKYLIDDKNLPENIKILTPTYYHLPLFHFRNRLGDNYFKAIERLIKKKNIKFDLIHAHFAWPSGYAGAKLKEKYNIPLIITAHGYDIYDLPFRNELLRKKVEYALNSADCIITVSNSNLKYINKLNIKTSVKIIPNGFRSDLFYPIPKDRARKKLNLSINKKIILNVGNLVEVKGHEYLILAIKEILKRRKDVMCIIVGSGELKKGLEKLVKKLNLQGHIKLVGAKPHEEIPLWMNACDVFVLPSIAEGFPTVLPEVLACGKPVVATRVGGIPEIINKKVGILAEPKKPEELAEALNKALEKEWDSEKIIQYSKQFTWKEISQRILKVYEEVLE